LKLAIDAAALVRDRRGMGRVTRGLVRALSGDAAFEVTLLARGRDARSLAAEFSSARIAAPATARKRGTFDAVWYPFNGMRFDAVAPSVVTIHDAFAFSEPRAERIARMREQQPILRAVRQAAKLVTVSEWSRSEIVRELGVPGATVTVIPTPPDPFFFPAAGDVLPMPLERERFVLVVGASEARKNVRLALEACALALSGTHETLVIAGDLPAPERVLARELGVRCGEIAPRDDVLRALYRNASVVLVPSRAEGFGLVAVEALACGAAVIAANAAALPEATQGAAILLPAADAALWARTIRSLLDDPIRLAEQRARGAAQFADCDRTAHHKRLRAILREAAGDRS